MDNRKINQITANNLKSILYGSRIISFGVHSEEEGVMAIFQRPGSPIIWCVPLIVEDVIENPAIFEGKEWNLKQYMDMIGNCYRHFKGNKYRITNIAIHAVTGEVMVIYVSETDHSLIWCRPIEMFQSEVDHDKYPEVTQKYRFEKI